MRIKTDITALGELLIDFVHQGNNDVGYPLMQGNPGGAPGNFLSTLSKFGAKTGFLGKVGSDRFGRMLVKTFRDAGVETKGILVDDRYFTTLAFVTLDDSGDREFSFARKPGADTMLTIDELPKDLVTETKVFHFGTLSMTGEPARSTTKEAVRMAKEAGAAVVETDRRKLDQLSATGAHQGVVAMVAAHAYATVDEILENAKSRGEAPLIVLCDDLSDPHNLGAIIRTAECAGAHGVIIPKRRSVGLTAVVGKASAGALEYLPVARVSNITAAIDTLKKAGVWIYGTAAEGSTTLYKADLKGAAAIVIGNEGQGMSRLVSDSCDFKVSIPMKGSISSLNASAAAAIMLYEAVRQRSV